MEHVHRVRDVVRTWERLTFFSDYGHYRGTNPVISDDGRFMAFQLGKATERAGVGHGIFIYDFSKTSKGEECVRRRERTPGAEQWPA